MLATNVRQFYPPASVYTGMFVSADFVYHFCLKTNAQRCGQTDYVRQDHFVVKACVKLHKGLRVMQRISMAGVRQDKAAVLPAHVWWMPAVPLNRRVPVVKISGASMAAAKLLRVHRSILLGSVLN